jgi:hypothetical protein
VSELSRGILKDIETLGKKQPAVNTRVHWQAIDKVTIYEISYPVQSIK